MKKTKIINYKKILKIILILIWMLTIFLFSSENGEKSESTSKKVTVVIVETVTNREFAEDEPIIVQTDKIIRKLAHYTIYAIGGLLIMNYFYTTEKSTKQKILYSIILGAGYATTDELHQYFVSERSARIFDVGIDTLGVITGVLLYLVIRRVIETVKRKTQE